MAGQERCGQYTTKNTPGFQRTYSLGYESHCNIRTLLGGIAQLIADRAQDNVRELEGFLNRIAAYANLTRSPITLTGATLAVDALTPPSIPSTPSPEAIIEGVASYFTVPLASLSGPSRAKPIAEARHVAMYLLREDAQLPLKQIGRLLGGRDHSTVIHGCRKVSTRFNTSKGRQQLAEIQAFIHGSR